jgi:hypothetical protein
MSSADLNDFLSNYIHWLVPCKEYQRREAKRKAGERIAANHAVDRCSARLESLI